MVALLSWLASSLGTQSNRNRRRIRAILRVERLDERIVPSAPTTNWAPVGMSSAWGVAANWDNGLPDSTKVAVFPDGSGACILDSTVLAANRTVAGLKFASMWSNTLTLSSGNALTISSLSGDNTTGFKMQSGLISQATGSDIIVITGGGDDTFNKWSGGTIVGTAQSNIYINGQSTLLITANASSLGDNIIVGQDNAGGSTLEFNDQTTALGVVNNAGIQVSDATDDGASAPNQLLFNGNTVPVGKVTTGLTTSCADSFIDNYGKVIRSNSGTYLTELPIKNETSASGWTATIDVQSNLGVSGSSANKTAGYAVDQVGGNTVLENGSTLSVAGFFMNAGELLTYGTANCTMNKVTGYSGTVVTVQGGTMQFSADNTAAYGSLTVTGAMSWTGGTFQDYVNATMAGQQSQLIISGGVLTMTSGAHLNINVNGMLASGRTWTPVATTNFGGTSGQLTFDSGALFTISNPNPGTQITVTSK